MGYCVWANTEDFKFNKSNSENIVQAIKEGIINKEITEERWINFKRILECKTLEDIFSKFRFDVEKRENKLSIDFFGEKFGGYEYQLFKVIAPYIEDGFIEYRGEDGECWRYYFSKGECKEVYPKVIWEV